MSDFHLPTFKTKRLLLRHMGEDDQAFLYELDTLPEVIKFLGDGKPLSEEESQKKLHKAFANYEMFGIGPYLVEHIVTKEKIGRAGLCPVTIDGEFMWDVAFAFKPAYWNKGLATEAVDHLVKWAQENLSEDPIISLIRPLNLDAIHVVSKVGMNHWRDIDFLNLNYSVYKAL